MNDFIKLIAISLKLAKINEQFSTYTQNIYIIWVWKMMFLCHRICEQPTAQLWQTARNTSARKGDN